MSGRCFKGEHDAKEREADVFARRTLIPDADFERLRRLPLRDEQTIKRFAHEIGIAPGIVVGRLQHDGLLPYGSTLNRLKAKIERQSGADTRVC